MLFGHGFYKDEQSNMELYFDLFERLSLFYISNNKGLIYFSGNYFSNNIGTFGGSIAINTPDWTINSSIPP